MFFRKRKTETKPFLEQIIIYPIKSLDGISVKQIEITSGGSLKHDREFVILDEKEVVVNAKRFPGIHKIRAEFNEHISVVKLSSENMTTEKFDLENPKSIEVWLSEFFKFPVFLKRNIETGFPDHASSAPGPTIVSTQTLKEVKAWSSRLIDFSLPDLAARFRPNLLIGGVPAFFEDQLIGGGILFAGDVSIIGISPCPRCVVPTRNPNTGQILSGFAKLLTEKRRETLPIWANPNNFPHFYQLCLNTKIPESESGKFLNVGDKVILESDQWGDII